MSISSRVVSRAVARSALLACVAACSDAPDANEARWHVVAEDLPGALFSIAGTAEDDVWVAGADRGDGQGPTLAHYDGTSWTFPDTGLEAGDLLWLHVPGDGQIFAVGSEGTILRSDDDGHTFTKLETPDRRVVWGVWGSSNDDVWAVGGDASMASFGFLWQLSGAAFEERVLPARLLPAPNSWYKVWGTGADDVWLCGTDGAMVHWDGSDFEGVDSGTDRPLLTVHGASDGSLVTAVGGQFSATLVESSEQGEFEDVTPEGPPLQMFGVFHRAGSAYAVGQESTVLERSNEGWTELDTEALDVVADLHGTWIDPTGGLWAAGGQILSPPYDDGVLLFRGVDAPPQLDLE